MLCFPGFTCILQSGQITGGMLAGEYGDFPTTANSADDCVQICAGAHEEDSNVNGVGFADDLYDPQCVCLIDLSFTPTEVDADGVYCLLTSHGK